MSAEENKERILPHEEEEGEEEEEEGEQQGNRGDMDYLVDHKKDFYEYCLNASDKDKVIPGMREIVWTLVKQLSTGVELSKVILPVEFCERRSLLMKLTDFITNVHFAYDFSKRESSTPLDRILGIVKMVLSGFHIQPPGAKKPYNPIHGEVFRCHQTDPDDNSIVTFLAEQVSHHPPISAFYGENKQHQITMEGYYHPQSKFFGNSVGAIAAGNAVITFKKFDEIYTITWPDYFFRNLISVWGSMKLEIAGTIKITCPKTGYRANLKMIPKAIWGGDWHCVDARIWDGKNKKAQIFINGKWTDKMYIRYRQPNGSKSKKELFIDTKDGFKPTPFQFISREKLEEYESQRVWGKLTENVIKHNLEESRKAKVAVEEAQRAWRRDLKKRNLVHKHRFFRKREDKSWEFIGKDRKMYKILLKKWLP